LATSRHWGYEEVCINVDCTNKLSDYIIERQQKSKKYRFCKNCRNNKAGMGKIIRWECVSCKVIISSTNKALGTYYCNDKCKGRFHFSKKYHEKKQIKKDKKKCIYCTKELTRKHSIKFCDDTCFKKNKKLEKHKKMYKDDMIRRSNARHVVMYPNYNKEKREKNKEYQKFYHKRWYNVKKVVDQIRLKQNI